ncbi:hypothetical protein E2C01_036461 [Portunus trituberculatus]|uniref:Uncharacterized protein n=1 Tax=Portunus trituberculatus TaxID=210409 RepID=A0A5B7F5Q9_PORTR|nr:hypothetical protein [Portunus trituberculatus]
MNTLIKRLAQEKFAFDAFRQGQAESMCRERRFPRNRKTPRLSVQFNPSISLNELFKVTPSANTVSPSQIAAETDYTVRGPFYSVALSRV